MGGSLVKSSIMPSTVISQPGTGDDLLDTGQVGPVGERRIDVPAEVSRHLGAALSDDRHATFPLALMKSPASNTTLSRGTAWPAATAVANSSSFVKRTMPVAQRARASSVSARMDLPG